MSNTAEQLDIIRARPGFIAALDQSGGSTPKALGLYGVEESAWSSEAEMFDLVHAMRTRIMTSPAFTRRAFWAPSCSRTPWTGRSKDSAQRPICGSTSRSFPS